LILSQIFETLFPFMSKKLLLSVFVLFVSALFELKAQTNVPAIISSNQTWTAAGSPYLISQNILIDSGVSVNILPGAVIKCTGYYRLIIDGEIEANGTKDSMVIMDNVKLDFNKHCRGYNFNTSTGSHFNYTWFKGDGQGGVNTIKLTDVSLYISNSRFTNCYYCIYAYGSSYDTSLIRVVKTRFESDNGYGSPTSASGEHLSLEMDECSVYNMCSMYVPANFKLTRSEINKLTCYGGIRIMNGSRFSKGKSHIACNVFKNFKSSVFETYYLDTSTTVNILNNTFDSADVFINFYVSVSNNYKYQVIGNNFLNARLYDVKFMVSSQTAGQFISHNMDGNYWGTTDTLLIAAGIYDFNDDITSPYKVSFNSFLNNPTTTCVQQYVGLQQQDASSFVLYPNPSSGDFTVRFNEAKSRQLLVYDLQGRVMMDYQLNDAQTIVNAQHLSAGIYMVLVRDASGNVITHSISISH
ncbi:MAG: T9SS type A sorting domain-containing protein, partial [Chitinophagaceae bacterium]